MYKIFLKVNILNVDSKYIFLKNNLFRKHLKTFEKLDLIVDIRLTSQQADDNTYYRHYFIYFRKTKKKGYIIHEHRSVKKVLAVVS